MTSIRLLADDLTGALDTAAEFVGLCGPFDVTWREALSAWTRLGSGRHPARLNFGDCLAYATARVANEPLLAKGGDFALTDIMLA